MKPQDHVREARRKARLSQADFGIALGYRHSERASVRTQVNDMEKGRKPVSPIVARLVEMFRRFGVPEDFISSEHDEH